MKIGYLGCGTWGFTLACLLAANGHSVTVWTRQSADAERLNRERLYPKLPPVQAPSNVVFTSDLHEALRGAEVIVESVTSSGIRSVFTALRQKGAQHIPIILTSKGIEQGTGLLLPEVVSEILGETKSPLVGALSGPSHAEEVIKHMPTSVVCSGYGADVTKLIQQLFTTPTFRVYPNEDLHGVCFGAAMKNIIAIACGICDGLSGESDNAKAALMTRGLHEMRKLCIVKEGKPETLNGLSGLGDLCVTCMSRHSRNYRFGRFIADGFSPEGARQKVGMAVEGIYSCVSAHELSQKHKIATPVTDVTYAIIYGGLDPRKAVELLLTRAVKEEHL